jgi:hypothetical protein
VCPPVTAHHTRRPWARGRDGLARLGSRAVACRLPQDGEVGGARQLPSCRRRAGSIGSALPKHRHMASALLPAAVCMTSSPLLPLHGPSPGGGVSKPKSWPLATIHALSSPPERRRLRSGCMQNSTARGGLRKRYQSGQVCPPPRSDLGDDLPGQRHATLTVVRRLYPPPCPPHSHAGPHRTGHRATCHADPHALQSGDSDPTV